MATNADTDTTAILAELRATLRQLQTIGVPVGLIERDGVLWIGLRHVRDRRGRLEFNSEAALVEQVTAPAGAPVVAEGV
jgi:hypothetical protein